MRFRLTQILAIVGRGRIVMGAYSHKLHRLLTTPTHPPVNPKVLYSNYEQCQLLRSTSLPYLHLSLLASHSTRYCLSNIRWI